MMRIRTPLVPQHSRLYKLVAISRRKHISKYASYMVITLDPNNNSNSSNSNSNPLDYIETVVKFIFSWIVLMPISVIISGKLLAEVLKLRVRSRQLFKITIPRLFVIQATDNEVILGFTGFIMTLVAIAIPIGHYAYVLFREQFGIDPGQFNSLCILSSFSTVIWTFALFVLLTISGKIGKTTTDPIAEEHKEIMDKLSKGERLSNEEKGNGDESAD